MAVTAADDAADYRRALARKLRRGGVLDDPAWFRAFATVPREAFVRGGVLQHADGPLGTWWQPLTPDDPRFLREVYRDVPLATQVDGHITAGDLAPGSGATGAATCSSSQPGLMALMLDHLRVESDITVLEIGAGVGYNAAILAAHVGADRVTTIEFDAVLAETARAALAGYGGRAPTVVTGDGARIGSSFHGDGWPDTRLPKAVAARRRNTSRFRRYPGAGRARVSCASFLQAVSAVGKRHPFHAGENSGSRQARPARLCARQACNGTGPRPPTSPAARRASSPLQTSAATTPPPGAAAYSRRPRLSGRGRAHGHDDPCPGPDSPDGPRDGCM